MIFEMIFIISLVVIICMLTMLANKIKIAYPICSSWQAWH